MRRLAGAGLVLRLWVRRFFCDNHHCRAHTFTERVPGLTYRYARHSPQLHKLLEAITLALRAGRRPTGADQAALRPESADLAILLGSRTSSE
jgi:hypothetical protein